jgi:hypothetical protein
LKQQIAKTKKRAQQAPAFVQALDIPADELSAMHTGLVRRMNAWREAHDAAAARLDAILARTDSILERCAPKH